MYIEISQTLYDVPGPGGRASWPREPVPAANPHAATERAGWMRQRPRPPPQPGVAFEDAPHGACPLAWRRTRSCRRRAAPRNTTPRGPHRQPRGLPRRQPSNARSPAASARAPPGGRAPAPSLRRARRRLRRAGAASRPPPSGPSPGGPTAGPRPTRSSRAQRPPRGRPRAAPADAPTGARPHRAPRRAATRRRGAPNSSSMVMHPARFRPGPVGIARVGRDGDRRRVVGCRHPRARHVLADRAHQTFELPHASLARMVPDQGADRRVGHLDRHRFSRRTRQLPARRPGQAGPQAPGAQAAGLDLPRQQCLRTMGSFSSAEYAGTSITSIRSRNGGGTISSRFAVAMTARSTVASPTRCFSTTLGRW